MKPSECGFNHYKNSDNKGFFCPHAQPSHLFENNRECPGFCPVVIYERKIAELERQTNAFNKRLKSIEEMPIGNHVIVDKHMMDYKVEDKPNG